MGYRRQKKCCYYFDERGIPIGPGCPRVTGECAFVHPDEPDWERLLVPGHRRRNVRSPYRPRHLSRSSPPPLLRPLGPLKDRISPHRASTSTISQDRSVDSSLRHPSPSPINRSPISPKAPRSGLFVGPPSKSAANKDNKESEELRDPADPTVISSVTSHGNKGEPSIPHQSSARTPQLQGQSKINTRPLVNTPSASNVQLSTMPFPPLPAPPAFFSAKKLPLRTDLTMEQKRQVWAEYIQLLADNIQQSSELKKLDGDINLLERMAAPASEGHLTEANRTAVKAKLVALNAQRTEVEIKQKGTFNRIVAAENWPVAPTIDNEDKEALSKAAAYQDELLHTVEKINNILARSTSVVPSDTSVGDPARPLKRRRMDEADKEEQQEPQARATSEVSEELRDRVLSLYETMTSIQNDQTNLRNDLGAEYKEYIDLKMEDAAKDVAKSFQAAEEKYRSLESNVQVSDNDLGELAVDIEKLMLDNQSFDAQIAETNQTIRDTIANIAQLQQRQHELTKRRDQHTKAIEALQAAVAAHTVRPASPPISPVVPPIDYIIQTVHQPVLDAARSAIKPLLASTKEDIEGLLEQRNTEMYHTLWNKLGLTLKVVDALSARILPLDHSSVDASNS